MKILLFYFATMISSARLTTPFPSTQIGPFVSQQDCELIRAEMQQYYRVTRCWATEQ